MTITDEQLKQWRKLCEDARLWRGPWTARTFEIDCPCPNDVHCGFSHSCEEVEALEAYPNGEPGAPAGEGEGQCVVQISVPGLETFSAPAARFIAAARTAVPALLDEVARLRAVATEAMHELLHVDAHINDRVAVAKRVAEAIGHAWPPYSGDDEDGDDDTEGQP